MGYALRSQYPVDWDFILREIRDGYVASPLEVKRAFAERAAKLAAEQAKGRQAALAREAAQLAEWRRVGGQL